MERRRRVPRIDAGWSGKYRFEDDPNSAWSPCRLVDISILGVGLELFGFTRKDLVGHTLVVQLEAPAGASVTFRLVGKVRYTGPGSLGGTRVGIEFIDLSDTEREILRAIELMHVVW